MPVRKLTRKKKTERYDTNHAAARKVYDSVELFPKSYLVVHQKGGERKPASGSLSFERAGSRASGPLSFNRSFNDSRGVPYTRDGNGAIHRVRV